MGPQGTEFEGGHYHGRIVLPTEYPMKPPSIIMLTVSHSCELDVIFGKKKKKKAVVRIIILSPFLSPVNQLPLALPAPSYQCCNHGYSHV